MHVINHQMPFFDPALFLLRYPIQSAIVILDAKSSKVPAFWQPFQSYYSAQK
jgi:hypothetical protein